MNKNSHHFQCRLVIYSPWLCKPPNGMLQFYCNTVCPLGLFPCYHAPAGISLEDIVGFR